eukprot:COSAG01_NODE_2085_length_8459_cov_14.269139_7_plen_177_part_00
MRLLFWRWLGAWHMECGQPPTWSRLHLYIWPDNNDRITNDRSHSTGQGSWFLTVVQALVVPPDVHELDRTLHSVRGARQRLLDHGAPRTWPCHCLDACPAERRSSTGVDADSIYICAAHGQRLCYRFGFSRVLCLRLRATAAVDASTTTDFLRRSLRQHYDKMSPDRSSHIVTICV